MVEKGHVPTKVIGEKCLINMHLTPMEQSIVFMGQYRNFVLDTYEQAKAFVCTDDEKRTLLRFAGIQDFLTLHEVYTNTNVTDNQVAQHYMRGIKSIEDRDETVENIYLGSHVELEQQRHLDAMRSLLTFSCALARTGATVVNGTLIL